MTITQDLELLQGYIPHVALVTEALARVRSFCESSIAVRLARVEEDLRAFRAEHEQHRHRTLGDTQVGTGRPDYAVQYHGHLVNGAGAPVVASGLMAGKMSNEPERCLTEDARNAVDRIAAALDVTLNMRNSDATNLRSLEAGLVLRAPRDGGSWANVVYDDGTIPSQYLAQLLKINGVDLGADQDARSWAKIEEWHAAQKTGNALDVSFQGPFERHAVTSGSAVGAFHYAVLLGGHSSRGNTRSDALAHAAQWCEHELDREKALALRRGQ